MLLKKKCYIRGQFILPSKDKLAALYMQKNLNAMKGNFNENGR
jgi:hypothetical protein